MDYNLVEIAKKIKADLKSAFPKYKFSVEGRRGYKRILITLREVDFNPFAKAGTTNETVFKKIDEDDSFTDKGKALAKKVLAAGEKYMDGYERGDNHWVDNYSLDVYFGDYEKPLIITESKKEENTEEETGTIKGATGKSGNKLPIPPECRYLLLPFDCIFDIYVGNVKGKIWTFFKPNARIKSDLFKSLAAVYKSQYGIFYAGAYGMFLSTKKEFSLDEYKEICLLLSEAVEEPPVKKEPTPKQAPAIAGKVAEKPAQQARKKINTMYGVKLKMFKIHFCEGSGDFDGYESDSWSDIQDRFLILWQQFASGNGGGYDKCKVEVVWENGSRILDRADLGYTEGDFNPTKITIGEFLRNNDMVHYETNVSKAEFNGLSWSDAVVETKNKYEVEIKTLNKTLRDLYNLKEMVLFKNDAGVRKQIAAIDFIIDELVGESGFNADKIVSNYFSAMSNGNEEIDADIIYSPSFIDWFGDWMVAFRKEAEEADPEYPLKSLVGVSKVCNRDTASASFGVPTVVYHGSASDVEFSRFKFDKFPVMYFAENKTYADWFANIQGGVLFKCYLNIKELADFTFFGINKVYWNEIVEYSKRVYNVELPQLHPVLEPETLKSFWQYLRGDMPHKTLIDAFRTSAFNGFCHVENNPNDMLPSGEENTTLAYTVFEAKNIKSATVSTNTGRSNSIMKL
jgi:hypothetical protein